MGNQTFDIEFRREGQETAIKVTKGDADAVVRRRFDTPR